MLQIISRVVTVALLSHPIARHFSFSFSNKSTDEMGGADCVSHQNIFFFFKTLFHISSENGDGVLGIYTDKHLLLLSFLRLFFVSKKQTITKSGRGDLHRAFGAVCIRAMDLRHSSIIEEMGRRLVVRCLSTRHSKGRARLSVYTNDSVCQQVAVLCVCVCLANH